jgi:subtilisin-like proprotein convertase family protein
VVGYTNSTPLPIPANQCVISTITINDQFAVGRLLAGVNLTHPNRAELAIRLLSPGIDRVYLLGPAANSGQDLDTLFDDSAAEVVPAGLQNAGFPFFDYIHKSSAPLLQFRGLNVKGIWKLEICNSGSSSGQLNRWVIVIPEFSDFQVHMPIIKRNSK